jgi:acetylornithine deacetylase
MTAAGAALEQEALARIDEQRIVDDTCELIRGRGENPGETEAETVRRLRGMCERIGATVITQEFEPGRENLRAVLGPEDGPAILFLGHSDVVPAGEGWTADPFEPRIADGCIVGRGATDMKGGLAAVLAAMRAVHLVAPELRLELLCTGDEEDRAQGVLAALGAAEALDRAGSPREYLACVVAEPTDLDTVVGCRGASNFLIECLGASAHAGRPEDGASSIYAASATRCSADPRGTSAPSPAAAAPRWCPARPSSPSTVARCPERIRGWCSPACSGGCARTSRAAGSRAPSASRCAARSTWRCRASARIRSRLS